MFLGLVREGHWRKRAPLRLLECFGNEIHLHDSSTDINQNVLAGASTQSALQLICRLATRYLNLLTHTRRTTETKLELPVSVSYASVFDMMGLNFILFSDFFWDLYRRWSSSVSMVSNNRLGDWSSIPGRGKGFFL
jgi:hypothetical protein